MSKKIFGSILILGFVLLVIVYIVRVSNDKGNIKDDSLAENPKLVVGIVVDQMKYQYLTKFWNHYSNKGFKQLINKGFIDLINEYSGNYSDGAMKFAISAIIISAPIYYFTSKQIYKNLFKGDPFISNCFCISLAIKFLLASGNTITSNSCGLIGFPL